MGIKIEKVTEPVTLGEGPHWDANQQCLYYVSILDHSIHKYVPETGIETKAYLKGNVGFIVPLADKKDHFVVGVDRKILLIHWDGENTDEVKVISEITEVDKESGYNTNRINDGKSDPKGRLFAGTMGKEDPPGHFQMGKGSLFVFNKEGANKKVENVHISNGLCWDVKKNIMYYIDSLYGVRAYNYDFDTGKMASEKKIFDFKEHDLEGVPDGMTIDIDGNLWIACFDGSQVIEINPTSGEIIQNLPIPALQVTSVAFGGKNLDELYVTTASMNIKEEQKPPCGSIFKITGLGVKGYPGDSCIL